MSNKRRRLVGLMVLVLGVVVMVIAQVIPHPEFAFASRTFVYLAIVAWLILSAGSKLCMVLDTKNLPVAEVALLAWVIMWVVELLLLLPTAPGPPRGDLTFGEFLAALIVFLWPVVDLYDLLRSRRTRTAVVRS